jgi:hypothetical protein
MSIIAIGLASVTAGCASFDYPAVPAGSSSATIRLTRTVAHAFTDSESTNIDAYDNPDCNPEGMSGNLDVLIFKPDTSQHVVVADSRIWLVSVLVGDYLGTGADVGYPQRGRPANSIPYHGQRCMTQVAFTPRAGREYIAHFSGSRTQMCQMTLTEANGAPVEDVHVMAPTFGCRDDWKIGPEFANERPSWLSTYLGIPTLP